MADKIQLYPYMSTPSGIEVCFSRNGGAIEQKHFPPGTPREKIMASLLSGKDCHEQDITADEIARIAKSKRAKESKPSQTRSEEDLKEMDLRKGGKIVELNMMRTALKVAKVKGYQLFGEERLRTEYEKIKDKQES